MAFHAELAYTGIVDALAALDRERPRVLASRGSGAGGCGGRRSSLRTQTACASVTSLHKRPAMLPVEAGLMDAAQMFARTGVRRLPVVSANGQLVGIVSLDDLMVLLGNEMGHVAAALTAGLRRAGITAGV